VKSGLMERPIQEKLTGGKLVDNPFVPKSFGHVTMCITGYTD